MLYTHDIAQYYMEYGEDLTLQWLIEYHKLSIAEANERLEAAKFSLWN